MGEDANQITNADIARWRGLYRAAGVAALTVVGFMVVQVIVFFMRPPPTTVIDWFALFNENRLVGLLDMDLLLMVDYLLLGLVYLALYVALRRASESLMAIAAMFALLGIAAYLASTTAFNMLSLSNQYAVAATDAERSELLAAGRATVALWTGTAFDVSYLLSAIAILIISVVMLRSDVFNRLTAWVGLVMGITMTVPPTAGTFGLVLSLLSLLPTAAWLVLIARRFFDLARQRAS